MTAAPRGCGSGPGPLGGVVGGWTTPRRKIRRRAGSGIGVHSARAARVGVEIQIPDVVADLLLNVESFLRDKGPDTKAFHHRYRRVGLQESSPQNNFRRIIAALISAGEFCNHNVNYLPEHTSQVPLEFALGLLNSKLGDWYFRLGST